VKIFLLCILVIPTLAIADKKLNSKDMSMLGKIDESSLNQIPVAKKTELTSPAKTESKVTMSCKDKAGVIYNQGQVGYDNCLNDLKNRSDFSKKNSGVNVNDSQNGVSSGINFKIGN
jgi:hypothetical protein